MSSVVSATRYTVSTTDRVGPLAESDLGWTNKGSGAAAEFASGKQRDCAGDVRVCVCVCVRLRVPVCP